MTIDKRRGGFYWEGDKPFLSVTTVLQTIDKPSLRYWFGQQVYYAMLKDPTMSEKDALASPYQTSKGAMSRGSTVHSIVEAFKSTEKRIESIPQHIQPYAFAFYDFMTDHKLEMLDQEKTLTDPEHRIAGTLDIYGKLGDKMVVLDVKTGKDIYQEAGLQLSAYAHMVRQSGKKVDEIGVILLETGADGKPTGKYKFQTMTESMDAFLACKTMYEYVNREKLIKVGYLE